MRHPLYCQVEPANAGFRLLDTAALLRARSAYKRLLGQIENDPLSTGSVAEENVGAYLAEIDEALAARDGAAA